MANNLSLTLKINADARQGETNLGAFVRNAKSQLESLGKTKVEIKAIEDISRKVREGKTALASLKPEVQKLVSDFNKGFAVNQSRDFLGLKSHAAIRQSIQKIRDDYAQMKASGQLSFAETRQAALRAEERIQALKEETNGWIGSLAKARVALAQVAAAGAGLAYVARAAMDFETAMANVAKVVDGADEEIAGLSERIKAMAQEMPVAGGLTGLADIAAAGGQLGIPLARMEEFITLTVKMSNAFGMSADEAGRASAVIMNSFALPLSRVGEVADAVNVLGNSMATTERDIIEVMTRIGGASQQFGLAAEEAAALSASLLSLGKSPMVVGTSINAMLSRLQTANVQGEEFRTMLERMGLSAEKLASDIRENPQRALLDFLSTLSRLDTQSRAEALVKLFGQEYQDDIAALLSTLDQYEAALSRVSDRQAVAGSLEAEYQKRLKTTQAQLDILKNNFESLAVTLGEVLLPLIKGLAEILGSVTQAIDAIAKASPTLTFLAQLLAAAAVSAGGFRIALLAISVAGSKVFTTLAAEFAGMKQSFKTAIAQTGKLKAAFGAMAVFLIGWDIGTKLREEFLVVEQAGIALAAGFTKLAERASAAWEILKNPGNIDGILKEMRANLKQIDNEYAELFAHAEKRRQKKPAGASSQAPPKENAALPGLSLLPPGKTGGKGRAGGEDPVLSAYRRQLADFERVMRETQKKIDNAQNGIDDAARRYSDSLEIWLATDENAKKLNPAQVEALKKEAAAVDGAAAAYKDLTEAKARAEEFQKAGAGFEIELLRLAGNSAEADRRELEARYAELRKKLDEEIAKSDSALAKGVKANLDLVVKLTLEKQEVDRVEAEIDKIQRRAHQQTSIIDVNHETGLMTDVEAQEALLRVNREQAAALRERIPLLERIAQREDEIGEKARAALIETNNQIRLLENTTTLFEATLKQGVSEGLNNAISGLVDGTMSLREAIHELSTTIFKSLLEMYSKNLSQWLMGPEGPLSGAMSGFLAEANKGADGAGGLLGALFGNGVNPAAGTDASAATQQMSAAQINLQAAQINLQAANAKAGGLGVNAAGAAEASGGAFDISGLFSALSGNLSGLMGSLFTPVLSMFTTTAATETTAAASLSASGGMLTTAGGTLSASGSLLTTAAGA
ncbi:MAG: phage tail tape measure protein, partial [Zoogloeaceae bacterium]|nr:phage tail tape measure protein [Zoogloeaceae bacterium]